MENNLRVRMFYIPDLGVHLKRYRVVENVQQCSVVVPNSAGRPIVQDL